MEFDTNCAVSERHRAKSLIHIKFALKGTNNYESYWYCPPHRRPGPGGHPQRDSADTEDSGGDAHGDFH